MNLDIVFNPFPQLLTDRLMLRQINTADRDAIFATFRQAAVVRYYDVVQPKTIADADGLIHVFNRRYENRLSIRWGIALRKRPEWLIGTAGYNLFDQNGRFAEIGYELHPDHWGQGIATEAMSEIVHFGFERIGLYRIEANVFAPNHASARVLTKLGFQHEGTLRQREFWQGERLDLAWYGILKEEFETQ